MRLAIVLVLASTRSAADPFQLRADALATTSAPAGLVTLAATGDPDPRVSAEAVVWTGGGTLADTPANVLVIALRARTTDGRASARIGRFVESLGGLRPVQIDGAAVRARLPYQLDVESFAGIPVPIGALTSRTWDWVAGGRLSRRLGETGSLGVAYSQQRDDGALGFEEIAIDGGAAIARRDDVAVRLAYDLATPGVAEASLSASHRTGAIRVELYTTYRAASHVLPATSLFTVLGDVPAERAGTNVHWKAAPRLDIDTELGVRAADDAIAPELMVRARLKLDDRGTSSLSGELRRDGVRDDAWTGARGAARVSLSATVYTSAEIELVLPDHDRGVGAVWPWGLVALGWDDGTWSAAIAGEACSSPEQLHRVDVLAQIGRRWGGR